MVKGKSFLHNTLANKLQEMIEMIELELELEYHHFATPNKIDLDHQSPKLGPGTLWDPKNPFRESAKSKLSYIIKA